jgi:hypothetical protein
MTTIPTNVSAGSVRKILVTNKFLFLSGNKKRKKPEFLPSSYQYFSQSEMSKTAMGPTQPPIRWVAGFLPGGKVAGT